MDVAELIHLLFESDTFTGATLSKPARPGPNKITVDPVDVRAGRRFRFRAHEERRTVDELLDREQARERLIELLPNEYRQGLIHAADADHQVLAGKKGATILRRPPTRAAATGNVDRKKNRVIAEGTPVPFLVALGVMTPDGAVRAQRQDKFRQVNRFLELVDDVASSLPEGRLRVVDFGSGRAYLTFALHHLLTVVHGREVEIVGLDLKDNVIAECNALTKKLALPGLRFERGDIASAKLDGIDLVVSLHACDIATDAALERAVTLGAKVILAVPCCQHELLTQVKNDALEPLLRHGALKERFCAEATDAARARLLQLVGYDVQLVELFALEHSPKNILIRATALPRPRPEHDNARLRAQYRTFADALAIEPALERMLGERLR